MFSLQDLMIQWPYGEIKIKMKEKFFYIDFIKVASCIAVMLFHLDVHSFYADSNSTLLFGLKFLGINVGDIAVSLFIISSGFGLGLSNRETFSIKTYAKKRFLAIYPSYWISYIVVALFFILMGKTIGEGVEPFKFLLTVIGLDGLFLYKFPTFYLVGEWYTGYMLITYIIFPLLFIYALRKPLFYFIILLVGLTLLHLNYSNIFEMWEPINPLMRLPEFFFGICFAQYIRKDKFLRSILMIFAIIFLVNLNTLIEKIPYHFVMIATGISFFIVISSLFDLVPISKNIKSIFNQLSKLSFLAFLVHHQVLLHFYNSFDVTHSNNLIKFSILVTVITLSFLYGYFIFPLVSYVTQKLNSLLFEKKYSYE